MGTVGDGISVMPGAWSFAGDTPSKFDEHVSKSVPLYHEGHDLVCDVSDFFVKSNSKVYEIGCSTGTLTYKMAQHNRSKPDAGFVGIDLEGDMIRVAEEKRRLPEHEGLNVEFGVGDVIVDPLDKCDMIVAYYTVQFIDPAHRQTVIDKFYNSLNWGGALLLFEKVRGADARFQDILTALYTDYKLRRGYSPQDIVSKSRSLKGILDPFSTQGNYDMLARAGFSDINSIQKYLCFEGILAIK
ncbi:MAG: methyltransferase domain-containing protein [Dinoroseobacter sp.]|nr:methyltransferase domain-containing protein [Dinoroseobacter sp.]